MSNRILHRLLVILCSLLGMASATAQSIAIVGDMDGDGHLTVEDVTQLINTILGSTPERTLRLAEGETPWPDDPESDSHEYVDLGLPSGTLWATCNVGASSPEDYGSFFAWGETASKTDFAWSNYGLCEGSSTTLTHYCTSAKYGHPDGLALLANQHDAAAVRWGSAWCMPTVEQVQELLSAENTIITPSTRRDTYGFLVSSLHVDASIFLPASGSTSGTKTTGRDVSGYYWTKSLSDAADIRALCMVIDSYSAVTDKIFRMTGCAIRPVRSKFTK